MVVVMIANAGAATKIRITPRIFRFMICLLLNLTPRLASLGAESGGLADHVQSPAFATSVGLVMYAHRNSQLEPARVGAGAIGRFTGRLRTLFKDFF